MRITICGSIAFYEEMEAARTELESLGHRVELPESAAEDAQGERISAQEFYRQRKTTVAETSWLWSTLRTQMRIHCDKIAQSDAVLVVNLPKNGIDGYIGANSFLQMGLALHLGKKLFTLHALPDQEYIREELLAMEPTVLEGRLERIG